MSEKNTEIFREKSLKRISSPEDLDKYIKSTTPSLWLLLVSIIILLVGIIAWATFGKIESSSNIGISVSNSKAISYIQEEDSEKIVEDTYIKCNDEKFTIKSVDGPYQYDETSDAYLLHAADLQEGDWYYIVEYNANLSDGDYKGTVVFNTISPITFIIN